MEAVSVVCRSLDCELDRVLVAGVDRVGERGVSAGIDREVERARRRAVSVPVEVLRRAVQQRDIVGIRLGEVEVGRSLVHPLVRLPDCQGDPLSANRSVLTRHQVVEDVGIEAPARFERSVVRPGRERAPDPGRLKAEDHVVTARYFVAFARRSKNVVDRLRIGDIIAQRGVHVHAFTELWLRQTEI